MKKLLPWFAALALLIIIFGSIYTVVQQSQRRNANDPQIQMAEDTAAELDANGIPLSYTTGRVDIDKSLKPFVTIYDKQGNVISTSGYLDNKAPKAPIGVLKAAQGQDYHAVTWEPKTDVRVAAVTVAAKDYYVLSGRNLREVEKNENASLQLSLLGGVVALVLFGLVFALHEAHADDF